MPLFEQSLQRATGSVRDRRVWHASKDLPAGSEIMDVHYEPCVFSIVFYSKTNITCIGLGLSVR